MSAIKMKTDVLLQETTLQNHLKVTKILRILENKVPFFESSPSIASE